MNDIIVTGGDGQLGRELSRQWDSAVPLSKAELNITDRDAVWKALKEMRPRALVNAAAFVNVDLAESEPAACQAVNVQGARHLAEICRESGCLLVQISSDYVFSGAQPQGRPWREDDPPIARGVYAQSKFAAEQIVAEASRHLIVRTCGLYSSADRSETTSFVNTMLRLARAGRMKLRVVDDQRCTPSYAPHVARAVVFLVETALAGNAPFGVYHVTNRSDSSWHGFAAEIFRLGGLDVDLEAISTEQFGAPAPRPKYSVLDVAKYHQLGGPVLPTWQDALAERMKGAINS